MNDKITEASIPKNSTELPQTKSPKKDNYHDKIFSKKSYQRLDNLQKKLEEHSVALIQAAFCWVTGAKPIDFEPYWGDYYANLIPDEERWEYPNSLVLEMGIYEEHTDEMLLGGRLDASIHEKNGQEHIYVYFFIDPSSELNVPELYTVCHTYGPNPEQGMGRFTLQNHKTYKSLLYSLSEETWELLKQNDCTHKRYK